MVVTVFQNIFSLGNEGLICLLRNKEIAARHSYHIAQQSSRLLLFCLATTLGKVSTPTPLNCTSNNRTRLARTDHQLTLLKNYFVDFCTCLAIQLIHPLLQFFSLTFSGSLVGKVLGLSFILYRGARITVSFISPNLPGLNGAI